MHVELRLGDFTIAVSSRDAVPEQGLPAPTAGHPLELVLGCESADDAVAALRAAGSPVLVEPYRHPAGHRRAYVADPDGNWIAVVSSSSRWPCRQPSRALGRVNTSGIEVPGSSASRAWPRRRSS